MSISDPRFLITLTSQSDILPCDNSILVLGTFLTNAKNLFKTSPLRLSNKNTFFSNYEDGLSN